MADGMTFEEFTGGAAQPAPVGMSFEEFTKAEAPPPGSVPRTDTTLAGLEGAATRGVAPYAAGAGLGALMGAPIGGVGAIPGAAAGAGAVGLTDLLSHLYNAAPGALPKYLGLGPMPSASDAVNALLDKAGVEKPQTSAERVTQALTGGAASALTGSGVANQIAQTAASPTAQGIAQALATKPWLQGVSGASSGASGQTAAEAGLGSVGQSVAALAGGAFPYGVNAGMTAIPRAAFAEPTPQALEAHQQGYVLPPGAASQGNPSALSQLLQALPGKTGLTQASAMKNSGITEQLAASSLGLSPTTQLTDAVFNGVRAEAGKAYGAVESALPEIKPDAIFKAEVSGLGGVNSEAAQFFPSIMKNDEVSTLTDTLSKTDNFTPRSGLEAVKQLRGDANSNLQAVGDPSKRALGLVQRQAADAIDNLIERNIQDHEANPISGAQGTTSLIDDYRAARQQIAKSYDLQSVTNPATGEVNALGLARLAAKGKPLSGDLKTIADTAAAFPKAMQSPASFGGNVPALSPADLALAGGSIISGHAPAALAVLGRPLARATVLSKPYQNWMMNQRPMNFGSPLPFAGLGQAQMQDPRAALANILSQGSGQ